jgi:polyisoprenoid-binding protein YceI
MNRAFVTPTLAAALLLISMPVAATPRSYEIGTADKNTSITFESESEFETILGTANQAHGAVTADLDAGTGNVEIAVPLEALHTGIELRDKHLKSSSWLDARQNPEIRFVSENATRIDDTTWKIDGTLTLHGVTKPLSVEAKVRPISEAQAKSAGLGSGDWLRVLVPFEVRLSDFGVEIPKKVEGRVSDVWKVRASVFAQAKG